MALWLGWVLLCPAPGPAQDPAPVSAWAGKAIRSIAFDPEAQPLPRQELDSLLPFRPGDAATPARVRLAIEQLYATGRYRQIRVEAIAAGSEVDLRFRTEGTWFIGRIGVDGVPEPPNRGQLVNASKLQLGQEFSQEQVRQATENLRAKLESNGFFEARVDPAVNFDDLTQQVRLDFRVDPGPRARFVYPTLIGLEGAERDRFVRLSRWKRFTGLVGWRDVTEARLQRGLDRARRDYSRRDYLLNSVRLVGMDYDAVRAAARPTVEVNLGPKVALRSEGSKISRSRLRQLVPVFQEQAVDADLLAEGVRRLTAYFGDRGYFRAAVAYRVVEEPSGTRALVFDINRGLKYRLVRLDVTGNRYFPSTTIRERMNVLAATRVRFRQGRFNDALLRSDLDAIRDLYQSNGFRNVAVAARVDENYNGRPDHLAVTIEIDEGPQWRVARRSVHGVSPALRETVESLISSDEGQPFSDANLTTDRDVVLDYYYNLGFSRASFDWVVTPAADPHEVEIRFEITEGEQEFVRDLLISGLTTSDPEMVAQRIRLGPGDPLSQARIVESQRRLYDLGVFARVDIAVQNPDGQEQGKFLIYQFEEARRYSVNFGLGAEIARIGGGTPNFDAPAGEPGFSPRVSLGLARTNVFGTGHTVGAQTRLSNIQQRVVGTYLAPQFKGREDITLSVSALFDVSRDIRTFESRRQEGSLQLSRKLSRANTLQGRFTYRRTSVRNLAIDEALVPIYSRPVRVGVLSATLFQDYRDDPLNSTRGHYNSIDFAYASKAFASQTDHVRLLARNSTYHRLGRDLVLARSLMLGLIGNLRAGGPQTIPLPERYFSGGAATHRGFPDNQAGPRDLSTGFPLGGSGLLMNNLELRFPLLGENIGAVLFHDAGNVYTSVRDLSFRVRQRAIGEFDYMVHAVGVGLRYRTPVGPVRLDFAYGLNPPRFQFVQRSGLAPGQTGPLVEQRIRPFQFHFSLGQTF